MGGKGNAKGQTPRLGLMMRKSRTYQDTYATGDRLNLPHDPKKQIQPAWTSIKFGKTKIQCHFPGHRNKGQVPRANNEATRMGKVECWSEAETQKSNNWVVALKNKTLMDHRRGFRHINKLRFPQMHIRAQEYYLTPQFEYWGWESIGFNFKKESAGRLDGAVG